MQIVNPLTAYPIGSKVENINDVPMRGNFEKQGVSFSSAGYLAALEDPTLNADAVGRAVRRQLRPLSKPTLEKARSEYARREVIPWARYAILEPTGFCNKACPFCSIHVIRRLDEHGNKAGLTLKWSDYIKFMEEASHYDVYGVSLYTLGEPMLWRGKDENGDSLDIRHMVNAAKRVGGYRVCNLSTNGDVDNMELLLDCDLDDVIISIDGLTESVYIGNRPSTKKDDPGAFERTINRTLDFLEKKAARGQPKPYVRIQCINKQDTAPQITDYIRFWIDKPGVDEVFIKQLDAMTPWVGYAAVSKEESDFKMSQVASMPCQHLWAIVAMSASGQFLACCHDSRSELWENTEDGRIPNIRNMTVAEWWNGEFMSKLRGEHSSGLFRHPCAQCHERDPWL